MANTIVKRVLSSTARRYAFFLTLTSDGSEETAYVMADLSALSGAPTKCAIRKLEYYGTTNAAATIVGAWDHTTDDHAFSFKGPSYLTTVCFEEGNGLIDPASAGGTGDLVLTTTLLDSGDVFSLYIELELLA